LRLDLRRPSSNSKELIGEMGYIESTLGPHERIIRKANIHWLFARSAWLVLIFFGIAAASLVAVSGTNTAFLGGVVLLLIGLGLFLVLMLPYWNTEIGVTSHRIIVKRGWFNLEADELELKAIEKINVRKGMLGKLVNYGVIVIHGTGVDDMILDHIADPEQFHKAIEEAINQNGSSANSA
jgi:uncharacterized membrane protein YdbT with pleckstrin-like domain